MVNIKIQCPAKINLTLEIVNKREDGFHNIKSIMQTISLYDYLTIQTKESYGTKILISGSSSEIPYDGRNLVYKACQLYLQTTGINNIEVNIYIEKNIPISAGLAGGSTNAAGTIYGLNKIFKKLSAKEENELCAKLGSDLNVCLQGGTILATSRGEVTEKLPDIKYDVTLIKPKHLGISAKEAYTKYAAKTFKPQQNMTEQMIKAIDSDKDIRDYLYNDLEYAVFDDYKELQKIKTVVPNSVMSGSGSTYFVLQNLDNILPNDDFLFFNNLSFVNHGVSIV